MLPACECAVAASTAMGNLFSSLFGAAKEPEHWPAFEAKMKAEGCSDAAIAAFKSNYQQLASGANLMISEWSISPVSSLPSYEDLSAEDPSLLDKTVMLKLNGGLGTGMGLEKAKSLLTVRDRMTFLDFIAKQTMHMRKQYGVDLAFMLMNSFSTSADTLKALKSYRGLAARGLDLEFVQNKAPKVDASDLKPATWEAQPSVTRSGARSPRLAGHRIACHSHLGAPWRDSTSGARPATATCTRRWWARARWTSCSRRASSTCSSPTRTTWAPRWTSSC